MHSRKEILQSVDRLLTIMDELREQCPWDRKQTNESLRHLTIEETYELADAILENNPTEIKNELGDLLLHIFFYAKIGSEQEAFDLGDVATSIAEKLIHRHPHVYGNIDIADEEEVKQNWEALKLKEGKKSVFEGVPRSLPSLIKAQRLQDKAAGVGFDWPDTAGVLAKIQEEIHELQQAMDQKDTAAVEAEFGDVLFSMINYARFLDINPALALERTNKKFIRRFQWMEQKVAEKGQHLQALDLDQMEELWQAAKNQS
ncbi:MAG: nucleoside triphosphate pyrophosphohydrolase [Flavobacteriaceae bacterium]